MAVGLRLGGGLSGPMAIETTALFVAVVDAATAITPLTCFAVPESPWLEAGFAIAFEERTAQPGLRRASLPRSPRPHGIAASRESNALHN